MQNCSCFIRTLHIYIICYEKRYTHVHIIIYKNNTHCYTIYIISASVIKEIAIKIFSFIQGQPIIIGRVLFGARTISKKKKKKYIENRNNKETGIMYTNLITLWHMKICVMGR